MQKSVKIVGLKDKGTDYQFWLTQSIRQRLEAIELLRQQYIKFTQNAQSGLQRVCRIVDKTQS